MKLNSQVILILILLHAIEAKSSNLHTPDSVSEQKSIIFSIKTTPLLLLNFNAECFYLSKESPLGIYLNGAIPFAKREVNDLWENGTDFTRLQHKIGVGLPIYFKGNDYLLCIVPTFEYIQFRYLSYEYVAVNYIYNGQPVRNYQYHSKKKSGNGNNYFMNVFFFKNINNRFCYSFNLGAGIRHNKVDDWYDYQYQGYSSPILSNSSRLYPFLRLGFNIGIRF